MYSPISKIGIKNFRNLGDVEIDFTESPIVCLVGENEAGKTSVIKAFSVCALHSSPRDQKDYIRDGTQMFGVAIVLEDGSQIVRLKTKDINKYQVIKPDGTTWETTKISEGLPVEVQNLMGLIEEPETKEYLHIRTYEDKLLFVVTPASANYKVMYNALKVEQLTKAIKNGSTEANNLRGRINETDVSVRTLEHSMNQIRVIDTEPLTAVRDRLQNLMSSLDKIERAKSLLDTIENCKKQMGVLRLLDTFKLEEIDIAKAYNLSSVGKTVDKLNELKDCRLKIEEANNTEYISTDLLDKINNIIAKRNELSNKKASAGALIHVSEIEEINESIIVQLDRARALMNQLNTTKNEIVRLDTAKCPEIDTSAYAKMQRVIELKQEQANKQTELEKIKTFLVQAIDWMKQQGVAFEICPNCGSDVMIDLDKIDNK